MEPGQFDYISRLVYDAAGIVLEHGKEYLVEARLGPLTQQLGLASLGTLVRRLQSEPVNGLHRQVVDAMTTNETYFFRDLHPFETLRTKLLPELIGRRGPQRTLRIWCGACSSGQEPYSIALLLREYFPVLKSWQVQLVATDLSRAMLERARQGFYNQVEMNRGLPALLLVKHFVKLGDQWQVKPELRQSIEFRELNLTQAFPPLPSFDIVFLRNVLIYFDTETKKRVLARLRQVLAPDGCLFLGGAETTLNLDDRFESVTQGKTVFYRLRN
jgi:chemotaxis protein methyltransferase CheR